MVATGKAFVFVVCGSRQHIETLHYSLHALQKFTSLPVYVLTDGSRNKIPVQHSLIVDVATPAHFNHHQASIFLKTGLHRFLPEGPLYCYLDTDVIALSKDVEQIFDEWAEPITFSPDLSTMDQFSPYAANCSCKHDYEKSVAEYKRLNTEFEEKYLPEYEQALAEIDHATAANKSNPLMYGFHVLRYYLSGSHYAILNGKYLLEKKTQRWQNAEGEYLDEKYNRHSFLKKQMNLQWNEAQQTYLKADGSNFFNEACTHLHKLIERDFGYRVTPVNFRQWNGGVFLFNKQSEMFMDFWYNSTMRIFELPDWKTRDQGTLIATVWHFNLQQHKTIPIRFNLIIDYFLSGMPYLGNLTFMHPQQGEIKPAFVHVFHHFGDVTWKVWQDIDARVQAKH